MKNNCCALFRKVIFFSLVIVCCVFSAIKKSSSVKELIEEEIKQQEVIPLINDDILQSVNAVESNKVSLQVQAVEVVPLVNKQIQEKKTKEKLVIRGNRAQSNAVKSKLLAPEVSSKVIVAANNASNDIVQKKSNKNTSSEHSSHEFTIAERTIAVANAITDDMITYKKHWSGNHTPSTFVMKVNNQEVKNGTTTDVIVKDDKLDVSFNYEFTVCKKAYRVGGKKLHYKVPQNVNKVTSTFSWDVNSNLVIDNAELLSSYEVG